MTEREVLIRPLGHPGDLGWVVMAHGELYTREFGWDATFEAFVARIIADYTEAPGARAAWIAEVDGERAGCVFCVHADDRTAKLRLLLVTPRARGLGLGTRLVDQCLSYAKDTGYDSITLWTNDILDSARHIYQKQGFTLVTEEPHHSFGHNLTGQTWERPL